MLSYAYRRNRKTIYAVTASLRHETHEVFSASTFANASILNEHFLSGFYLQLQHLYLRGNKKKRVYIKCTYSIIKQFEYNYFDVFKIF